MRDHPPAATSEASAAADAGGLGWLWPGLVLGAALRLLSALVSAPTPGDDVSRLVSACRWSEHPEWLGLSGVWPPLWTYVLGALMRVGGDAHAWARALGWVTTTAALPLFFLTIRDLYGDARRAGLATLLLALYYVHIWMAGTAYTEAPYTCVLFASLLCVIRAPRRSGTARAGLLLAGGLTLALAMLFRHEARLVGLVVLVWLFREAGRGAALRYAIPSLVLLAWDMVDPFRRGAGFADDARVVAELKLAEVTLHGSRLEALGRWVIMPAGSPSAVVMLLGFCSTVGCGGTPPRTACWRSRATRRPGTSTTAWSGSAVVTSCHTSDRCPTTSGCSSRAAGVSISAASTSCSSIRRPASSGPPGKASRPDTVSSTGTSGF